MANILAEKSELVNFTAYYCLNILFVIAYSPQEDGTMAGGHDTGLFGGKRPSGIGRKQQEEAVMANTQTKTGWFGNLKRGGAISGVTIAVFGAASFFLPFVTLPIMLVAGGVAGGAIAAAATKK